MDILPAIALAAAAVLAFALGFIGGQQR